MSKLEKVSEAGKAFLQAPAGHEEGPFGEQFCSTSKNFVSFSQIIHEYSLTIKMTTVIDKNAKKSLLFEFFPNDYVLLFS